MSTSAQPGRSWRLQGWDAQKNRFHNSVCHGDRALDIALKRLEADPRLARHAVAPA